MNNSVEWFKEVQRRDLSHCKWKERFLALEEYFHWHGHSQVDKEWTGNKSSQENLFEWVRIVRDIRNEGLEPPPQVIQQLNNVDFIWDEDESSYCAMKEMNKNYIHTGNNILCKRKERKRNKISKSSSGTLPKIQNKRYNTNIHSKEIERNTKRKNQQRKRKKQKKITKTTNNDNNNNNNGNTHHWPHWPQAVDNFSKGDILLTRVSMDEPDLFWLCIVVDEKYVELMGERCITVRWLDVLNSKEIGETWIYTEQQLDNLLVGTAIQKVHNIESRTIVDFHCNNGELKETNKRIGRNNKKKKKVSNNNNNVDKKEMKKEYILTPLARIEILEAVMIDLKLQEPGPEDKEMRHRIKKLQAIIPNERRIALSSIHTDSTQNNVNKC